METMSPSAPSQLDVLIVDDHQMLRDGLKMMLLSFRKQLYMRVTATGNAEKALQLAARQNFELVITDFKLPGMQGDEMVRRLKNFQSDLKVLALSSYADYNYVDAMIRAGAAGYLLKSVSPEEMLKAIQTIIDGSNYYCNDIALVLLNEAAEKSASAKLARYHLSPRELEILLLIAEGLKNTEIAAKLSVTTRTIDTHRDNLRKKLKVHNTAGLVRLAMDLKLLR